MGHETESKEKIEHKQRLKLLFRYSMVVEKVKTLIIVLQTARKHEKGRQGDVSSPLTDYKIYLLSSTAEIKGSGTDFDFK